MDDNYDLVIPLFEFINIIANQMITQKRKIEKFYNRLPNDKLKNIEERDTKKGL